jgi:hypothetical protein
MNGIPTGPNDGGLPNPTTLDCLSTACQTARAAVVNIANAIVLKCGDIAAANARASAFLAIAGAILGLAGALIGYVVGAIGVIAAIAILVAATVSLNWLILWVIIILVAIALLFITLWAVSLIQVAVLQSQLGSLGNAFASATQNVMKSCPPTCWGDLRIPAC